MQTGNEPREDLEDEDGAPDVRAMLLFGIGFYAAAVVILIAVAR